MLSGREKWRNPDKATYNLDKWLNVRGKVGLDEQISMKLSERGSQLEDAGGEESGWTIGGGVERKWTDRLSAKVEYSYLDLDSTKVRLTDPQFPNDFADYKFDHTYHLIRVGLNFSFGGVAAEPAPLK